jgi:SPP1 family predicted phage head-tail adaptor
MPAKFGAGQMQERVAFDKRTGVDDGYGNIVPGPFEEQFRAWAKFVRLNASETVMAGRLESHTAIIMQIHPSSLAKQIDTDWQARDVRRGTHYNIREISEDPSHQLFELLAESNVATG